MSACIPGEFYGLNGDDSADYTAQFADMAADASARQQPVRLKHGVYHTNGIPEVPNLHLSGPRGGGHSFCCVIRPTDTLLNWVLGSGFRSSFRDMMFWPDWTTPADHVIALGNEIYHLQFENIWVFKPGTNAHAVNINKSQAISFSGCRFMGESTGSSPLVRIGHDAGVSMINPNIEFGLVGLQIDGGVLDMTAAHVEGCGQWAININNDADPRSNINIFGGRFITRPQAGLCRFSNALNVCAYSPSCRYEDSLRWHVADASSRIEGVRLFGLSAADLSSDHGPESRIRVF